MTPEQMRRSGHLRIFVSYYRPHLAIFLLDMVCALGICLVDLLFPMVSRHALNELLPRSLYGAFFALMTVLLLAYVLKGVFTFIVTYWGHLLGVRIEADIRSDLFSHMQDLSFSFYDKNRTGQLMSRVTGDPVRDHGAGPSRPGGPVHLRRHPDGGLLRHAYHSLGAGSHRLCRGAALHPLHGAAAQTDDGGILRGKTEAGGHQRGP